MDQTEDNVTKDILVNIDHDIAYVAINRPQVMNALTRKTKRDLLQFFVSANDMKSFKAIILTGIGNRAFCAGTDICEMKDFSPVDAEQMLWLEHHLNDAIRHCNKPVIAAVNGIALGGGCLIPIICDYSVVSESAILGFPEINSGLPAPTNPAIPRISPLRICRLQP